ncbi:MAG: dephospho-CoA kinase [Phyllobacteriaceae bacterium]|nr:dephospho-CoA kinase [Phyllobacteriaceae bacterium]
MIVLGLTGSIGMGKTTTAAMFADEGVPVHDADAVVHGLYSGPDSALVEAAFPGVVVDGAVDRTRLSAAVLGRPEALRRLEAIVHPLVRRAEQDFLAACRARGEKLVVLDIPLLFETGREKAVDAVVVVTAAADIQRQRVLDRPGMTPEKFAAILARQMPDAEKRRRADHVIDTGRGFDHARAEVRRVIAASVAATKG